MRVAKSLVDVAIGFICAHYIIPSSVRKVKSWRSYVRRSLGRSITALPASQIPSCHPAMCAADSGKWHPNQRRRRQAQRMDTIREIAPLHAIATTASPVQRATCPLPFHGDRYSKKNKRKHSIKERTLIYRIGNADIIIHCICIRLPVVQNKTRLRHFRIYRPEMTDSGHEIGGERCR